MKNLYIFILLGLIFSCSSSEDAPPVDITPATLLVYTTANIDGVAFDAQISTDVTVQSDYGTSYSYQPQQNQNGGCDNINYSASLYPTFNEALPYVGVGFNRFIIEQNRDCFEELDYFDQLFPIASYDYSTGEYNYGVTVEYATKSDGSGIFYTSYGPQDSSASFEVTAIEAYDCGFNECMFLTGTFTCKLYNSQDTTDTVEVTNGTFKLSFKSYNP